MRPEPWRGLAWLAARECLRVSKLWTQTMLAPVVASILFILVFGLTKAVSNCAAGRLSDRFGRRDVLIAGWLVAAPLSNAAAPGRQGSVPVGGQPTLVAGRAHSGVWSEHRRRRMGLGRQGATRIARRELWPNPRAGDVSIGHGHFHLAVRWESHQVPETDGRSRRVRSPMEHR